MGYLTKSEVRFTITDDDLDVITGLDDKIFDSVLAQAEEEAKAYLRSRYQIDYEMRGITELATADTVADFEIGDRFYFDSNVYEAIENGSAGELVTDNTFFSKHDSRNPKLKQTIVYILLYHISARMTPRNIPEIRHVLYNGNNDENDQSSALYWLRNVRDGNMNLNLPLILNDDGGVANRLFRYGNSPSIDTVY